MGKLDVATAGLIERAIALVTPHGEVILKIHEGKVVNVEARSRWRMTALDGSCNKRYTGD